MLVTCLRGGAGFGAILEAGSTSTPEAAFQTPSLGVWMFVRPFDLFQRPGRQRGSWGAALLGFLLSRFPQPLQGENRLRPDAVA